MILQYNLHLISVHQVTTVRYQSVNCATTELSLMRSILSLMHSMCAIGSSLSKVTRAKWCCKTLFCSTATAQMYHRLIVNVAAKMEAAYSSMARYQFILLAHELLGINNRLNPTSRTVDCLLRVARTWKSVIPVSVDIVKTVVGVLRSPSNGRVSPCPTPWSSTTPTRVRFIWPEVNFL